MPIHVRTRNGGKSYALRVKHVGLPQPVYLTFDSEVEARRAGELAEAALNRGEMPAWLQGAKESPYNTIADVVRAYLRNGEVAASTCAPRIASAKMLPVGVVAPAEMLPAIAPATMAPPLPRRGYGHQDDAFGADRTDQRSPSTLRRCKRR